MKTSKWIQGNWTLAPLFVLMLLLAQPLQALAPTDIEVDSYLNQPLKARVFLRSADASIVRDLRVQALDTSLPLQFSVETDASGQVYVVVSTRQPVREPASTFALEFTWPDGQLVRDYSLLLDPQ
ncbi:MAG: hypothetical protein WD005_06280 [Haliea sp.]